MIGCSWVISPPQGKVEKWLTTPQNLTGAREEQLPKGRGNIPSKRGEKMLGRVKTIDVLYDLYALLRINLGVISWYRLPSQFSSAQFSRSVMSDSLRPHGLQHISLPCPSPTPGPYSNSCPSSQWCHPTISSSIIPFSSCLQSFLASGSFPMSQFFTSGSESIGVSASASMNILDFQWIFRTDFLQDWLVWSPWSPRDSQESSLTTQFKSINSLVLSFLYSPTLTFIHDYWKNHSFD